jgi:hypothetical protein
MRLIGLLALLLFVIVFFAAPAASYAQTAGSPAAVPDNPKADSGSTVPDQPSPEPVAPSSTDRALYARQPLMEHGGDLVFRETEENDGLCYSLRTYVMARDDKSSDATHLARKIKCTPARKFGIKSADIRIEEPSADKFKLNLK